MFREKDEGDLRNEILALKRQLNQAKNENSLLKVKIRKMQEEIVKKNKHIEVLLHPKKSSAFHKVMSENGATIIMNSLERNVKFQKLLDERNAQIKKLQSELEISRLYTTRNKRPASVKTSNTEISEKLQIEMPVKGGNICTENRKKSENKSSYSLTASLEGHCAYNVDSEDKTRCPRNSGSPESDLDRNELFCETPHKEIQQLHKYVIDVLSEVDMLKETIAQMQGNHKSAEHLLEKKEGELQKVQKEMKSFRNTQQFKTKNLNGKIKLSAENKVCIKNNRSPRKSKQKTRRNVDKKTNTCVPTFISCIDAVETQIQKDCNGSIETETESDGGI